MNLVEAAVAAKLLLIFLLLTWAMVWALSGIWINHQAQSFLLCRADGGDTGFCSQQMKQRIHQLTPWLDDIRVSPADSFTAFHIRIRYKDEFGQQQTVQSELSKKWSRSKF